MRTTSIHAIIVALYSMKINLTELKNVAIEVGEYLKLKSSPVVILLSGELGSGKTTFTKLLCEHLGVKDIVSSPTFIIQNEYSAIDRKVFHLDLYRLESEIEFNELNIQSLVKENNLMIIEWPEKFINHLKDLAPYTMYIDFKHVSDDIRDVTISNPK